MKKSILCLLLALCLCLSVVLAACKEETPDPNQGTTPPVEEQPPVTDTTEEGGKKGQIHYTEDTSAGVDVEDSGNENQQVDDNSSIRY